ncbi:hypothetical protein E2C01_042892 [Portunus trituberculatus]|uniref:Uncharacterized protein n=1 Tax=Portunus trituberculatus TaxID=210409 RepID=A0A5B7FVZ7_PORTR|nr:hypothetical protein [Portunus trituberculatus]
MRDHREPATLGFVNGSGFGGSARRGRRGGREGEGKREGGGMTGRGRKGWRSGRGRGASAGHTMRNRSCKGSRFPHAATTPTQTQPSLPPFITLAQNKGHVQLSEKRGSIKCLGRTFVDVLISPRCRQHVTAPAWSTEGCVYCASCPLVNKLSA